MDAAAGQAGWAASPSDIIHPGGILGAELVERLAFRFLLEGLADLGPHLLKPPAAAALKIPAQVQAAALDGQQNVVEGDFLRRSGQRVAALAATPAGDEPVRAELAEDLREEVGGHRLRLRQVLDLGELARTVQARELRLLGKAEVVVCDDLVNRELLRHCPADCEQHFVGKRAGRHSASQSQINALLVAMASVGKKVVRLKGGDPLIFGRAGEEMQALREAGIPHEIVPGVTAATASAAAGLPLTHRDHSSAVVFVTGHQCAANTNALDWAALAQLRATLCFYMEVRRLPEIARNLLGHGMADDMPMAVISEASLPSQKILIGSLRDADKLSAGLAGQPALVVVGEVVRLASFASTIPALQSQVRATSSAYVLA